jgi:hypothetical protein
MSIDIRKATPMLPNRPCSYCLSLQDDSVFADFDVSHEGRVVLVGISFDGYGYHGTAGIAPMDADKSKSFLRLINGEALDTSQMSAILYQYFHDNSDMIWKDALKDHNLLSE